MRSFIIVILSFFALPLIGQDKEAQKIVDQCIDAHGGNKYQTSHYSFLFREMKYVHFRKYNFFRYERHHKDGITADLLTNDGLKRTVNEKEVKLSAKDQRKFSNSVNSVHYFAFLPHFLNDAAVIKKHLGEESIKGTEYHKIQITFKQEGGGDDHEDVYVYWINTESNQIDYLAYSFHVDGGGVRFREAYNKREVGGILFQDYVNYKHNKGTDVADLGNLFEQQSLTELSLIELEEVTELN